MAVTLGLVRALVVSMVWLIACAVDEPRVTPRPIGLTTLEAVAQIEPSTAETLTVEASTDEPDLCALATALPADDLCSLICDPAALRAAMLEAGVQAGRCYLMLCALPEDVLAQVGVCLY